MHMFETWRTLLGNQIAPCTVSWIESIHLCTELQGKYEDH